MGFFDCPNLLTLYIFADSWVASIHLETGKGEKLVARQKGGQMWHFRWREDELTW